MTADKAPDPEQVEQAWLKLAKQMDALRAPSRQRGFPISLTAAASSGDLEAIEQFLHDGASLDETTYGSSSPLESALFANQMAAVELLLSKGARLPSGLTLLGGVRRSTEILDLLLKQGLKLSSEQLSFGLMSAIRERDVAVVARLLELGAVVTQEHLAWATEELKPLLQGRSEELPNISPRSYPSVEKLRRALERDESERKRLGKLVAGQIRAGSLDAVLDRFDRFGRTLLILAFEAEMLDVADALIGRGADPNASDDYPTAIYFAARLADRHRVMSLLDAGADPNRLGFADCTALMAAAKAGDPEIVQLLLEAGADPVLVGAGGQTAANEACGPFRGRIVDAVGRAADARGIERKPALVHDGRPIIRSIPERRGILDFLRYLFDGDSDFSVLAVRAPIEVVSRELVEMRDRPATRDVATRSVPPVRRGTFLLQFIGHPWSIELQTLFWRRRNDYGVADKEAGRLSSRLSTDAVAFSGSDTARAFSLKRYRAGELVERAFWSPDDEPASDGVEDGVRVLGFGDFDDADRYARELDLFVPPAHFSDDGLAVQLVLQSIGAGAVARLDYL